MELKYILHILNESWDETGFLGLIRKKRIVDMKSGRILLENLKKFSIDDSERLIDSELVRLLWFVPLFLNWQKERLSMIEDNNELIKQYEIIFNSIQNEIIRILGCP